MSYLILVRHGTSEYNKLGIWTGRTDVELSPAGIDEARRVGEALRGISIHKAHSSLLTRAKQTLHHIKDVLSLHHIPTHEHGALNERDYGIFTGKNKMQIKDEIGEETFLKLRRGWDHPIEQGETLKDVYHRVVPYFESVIAADLSLGLNTLVVAHGNSLRALVKHLDHIPDHEIAQLEIGHTEAHCYSFSADNQIQSKEIRRVG
jgi:2,3-bisphosphoglycerate-dependent phosphoglycerate mutase